MISTILSTSSLSYTECRYLVNKTNLIHQSRSPEMQYGMVSLLCARKSLSIKIKVIINLSHDLASKCNANWISDRCNTRGSSYRGGRGVNGGIRSRFSIRRRCRGKIIVSASVSCTIKEGRVLWEAMIDINYYSVLRSSTSSVTHHETVVFEDVHFAHWAQPMVQQPWIDAVLVELVSANRIRG